MDVFEGFELSRQQKALWESMERYGRYHAFAASLALRLEGPLEVSRLQQALWNTVERYEIFSTIFVQLPGMSIPFQVLKNGLRPEWRELTLHAMDDERETLGPGHFQEICPPFGSTEGPLIHATIVTYSELQHVLALSLHPLIADARTLLLLAHELSTTYAHDLHPKPLDAPLQYIDYASWQREQSELLDLPENIFARQQPVPDAKCLQLPFEKDSTADVPFVPGALERTIEPSLLLDITRYAQMHDTNLPFFLLTCWVQVLGRITGNSEIAVTTMCDSRREDGVPDALGLFSYPVTLQFRYDGSLLLHQGLTIGQQQASREGRGRVIDAFTDDPTSTDQGREQVIFAYTVDPEPFCTDSGLTWTIEHVSECLAPFKLKLSCWQREGHTLSFRFEFDLKRYQREQVARLADSFETFLRSAVEATDTPVGMLRLLGSKEQDQVLMMASSKRQPLLPEICVQDLFEQQVRLNPHGCAVMYGDASLSYALLNERANQIAYVLRQHGVCADVLVGIFLERSLDMIVATLGVLKAGGAYVPLDPASPGDWLRLQIEDGQLGVVLSQEYLLPRVAHMVPTVLCLDRDNEVFSWAPTVNIERINSVDHLTYVIYTSGSTGKPKGVAVTHRNLVHYTINLCQELGLQEPLHYATAAMLSVDLSYTAVFPALLTGGCLHMLSYATATDSRQLADYFSTHQIDVLKITASHLRALLREDVAALLLPRRYLIVGGEPFRRDLFQDLKRLHPMCEVINHYGPTETTVGVLLMRLQTSLQVDGVQATLPIGRPIGSTQIYILDQQGEPVPVGTPGELYIGGPGVARGYLHDPGQTAHRFLAHPFSQQEGERLYRTGDIVRFRPDFSVEFLGRVDRQVKIRGYRIELETIEVILSGHPMVQDVAVLEHQEAGNAFLLAYLVTAQRDAATIQIIRAFASEALPAYMVPARYILLQSMPLTRSGKTDYKALLARKDAQIDFEASYVPPSTPLMRLIATAWQEILGIEKIGISDNFFDLGGHSLLLVQLCGKLQTVLGRDVAAIDLLTYPTISALANYFNSGDPHGREKTLAQEVQDRTITRRNALAYRLEQRRGNG